MSVTADLGINVVSEFIAAFLLALVAWLRKKFLLGLAKADPRLPALTLILIFAAWLVINVSAVLLDLDAVFTLAILGFTSLVLFYFSWRELSQFWKVGLRGADESISSGLDYGKALDLCHNYLDFLGIGAAKLTQQRAKFESALLRCRHDVPIRFLLLSPTDEALRLAAKRAGRKETEYKELVLSSLRTIADLRNHRGLNIEVRFYKEVPIFRLMFIDRAICLVSYNIMGYGDGSQLPQLHVLKLPENQPEAGSFYHPLELYFERLWALSEPWDFMAGL